jgi:hypothetical protein
VRKKKKRDKEKIIIPIMTSLFKSPDNEMNTIVRENTCAEPALISTPPVPKPSEELEIIDVEQIPEPSIKAPVIPEHNDQNIVTPTPVDNKPLEIIGEAPKHSEIDITIGNILAEPSENQPSSVINQDLKKVDKPLPISNFEVETAILGEEPIELDILPPLTIEKFQQLSITNAAPEYSENKANNLQKYSVDHQTAKLHSMSEQIPDDIFDAPNDEDSLTDDNLGPNHSESNSIAQEMENALIVAIAERSPKNILPDITFDNLGQAMPI